MVIREPAVQLLEFTVFHVPETFEWSRSPESLDIRPVMYCSQDVEEAHTAFEQAWHMELDFTTFATGIGAYDRI